MGAPFLCGFAALIRLVRGDRDARVLGESAGEPIALPLRVVMVWSTATGVDLLFRCRTKVYKVSCDPCQ